MMEENERVNEAPAAPEEAPAIPEEASAVPEEAPAVPEEAPAVPEEAPAMPEEAPAAQPETPAAPEPEPEQKSEGEKRPKRQRAEILNIKRRKRKGADKTAKKERAPRHEVVAQQDIRYRGPLSYRHMMILGWLCVFFAQVGLVLSTVGKAEPSIAEANAGLITFGNYAGSLFMPFLLLANFSRILSSKQQFSKLLLTYGGLAVAMGLALPFVYEHYVRGLAAAAAQLAPEFEDQLLALFQDNVFRNGYLAYNLFIDLFLCTLFMFFLTYHFKRPVRRGWVIGFRLLSILPVAYELACIVIKTLCKNGNITLPMYASCFLTTKPPMMFAAFVALALFIKKRERVFLKNGRTYEEYGHFLETNANSLHFSVHACVTFIVAAVVDVVVFFIFSLLMTAGDLTAAGEQVFENEEMITSMTTRVMYVVQAAGFGESTMLFFVAPFVLLFSYTRKHADTKMDLLIPVIGVAAIAALYMETFFQVLCELPNVLQAYIQSIPGLDPAVLGMTEEELTQLMLLMMQTVQ